MNLPPRRHVPAEYASQMQTSTTTTTGSGTFVASSTYSSSTTTTSIPPRLPLQQHHQQPIYPAFSSAHPLYPNTYAVPSAGQSLASASITHASTTTTAVRPPDSGTFLTPADKEQSFSMHSVNTRLDGLQIRGVPPQPRELPTSKGAPPPPPYSEFPIAQPADVQAPPPPTRSNSRLASGSTVAPNAPPPPAASTAAASSSTSGKLSAEASEFVCFAVHRIWHRIPQPPRDSSSPLPPSQQQDPQQQQAGAPPPTVTPTGVVSPPGTARWYPAFFEAVHNLIHRANCSLPHILIALLYVARLRQAVPKSHTGEGSEFRVFVSALILAQKYHTDDRYANKTWSKMTGLPLNDMNTMEREFLTGVAGRLHVTREEYDKWLRSIQCLGQEHSTLVRRARLEQSLAVAAEESGAGDYDPLRRVRTWPERVADKMVMSPPTSHEI